MPLLGTRGAASARGFGMFGGAPLAYWIGLAYGSATNDQGFAVATDSLSNMYAVGFSTASPQSGQIIKYTNAGVVSWQKYSDRALGLGFKAATVDASGNLYVGANAYIVKLNSSGTLQEQKTLALSSTDVVFGKFAVDSSNNIYAAGYLFRTEPDIFVAKFDSSLVAQWARILSNTPSQDFAEGVAIDSSGNVYIGGYGAVSGTDSFLIAKYDSSGTIQWQRSFSVGSSLYGYGLAVDSGSNVYCVGSKGYVVKYDTSGTLQWQRVLTVGLDCVFYAACTDASNNVYATGYLFRSGGSTYDVIVVKYDSSGTLQWQRYLSSYTSTFLQEYGRSITIDAAGAINLVGSTNKSGSNDFLVLKLPADGSKTGTYTVAGYSFTYAAASGTDAAGTGTSATSTLTNSSPTTSTTTPTNTVSATTLTSSVTTI
jgi:hypothetical protein